MKQALALEIMLSGENVFLTGAAGSGKPSRLTSLLSLQKILEKKLVSQPLLVWRQLILVETQSMPGAELVFTIIFLRSFSKKIPKNRAEIIKNTDILVIDEISMLHDFRLDMVEEICRTIRQNDKPFGGIQVILCGDFFQLPPINRMVAELVVLRFILKLGEQRILRFVILKRTIARKIAS